MEYDASLSEKCFLCERQRVPAEAIHTILEMQGLTNCAEEKINIIKVIFQLLRVRWSTLETMFASDVTIPFCTGCLNVVVEVIFLREQLFQVECEIREKLYSLQANVGKRITFITTQTHISDDSEVEIGGSDEHKDFGFGYEGYRNKFQHQVMHEYRNRQMLLTKIDEINQNLKSSVECVPSMTQLLLEKNVFEVTDWEENETTKQDLTNVEEQSTNCFDPPLNILETAEQTEHFENEFHLGLVECEVENDIQPSASHHEGKDSSKIYSAELNQIHFSKEAFDFGQVTHSVVDSGSNIDCLRREAVKRARRPFDEDREFDVESIEGLRRTTRASMVAIATIPENHQRIFRKPFRPRHISYHPSKNCVVCKLQTPPCKRKSKTGCSQCEAPICQEHQVRQVLCARCFDTD